jgi:phenylalanyl-tRNA synthetase alpha chain
MMMKKLLQDLNESSTAAIKNADSIDVLESLRVKYLGKKGELTAILKQMGSLSAEERPVMGQLANEVRESLTESIEQKRRELEEKMLEKRLRSETIDVTIPGKPVEVGKKHPLNTVLDEVMDIFIGMGFTIAEGPEIEFAEYNFTKLNTQEGHPARDRSDTFYFTDDDHLLLRTQTSPVQAHVMETQALPIRIISPGRVYRKDEVDATHSPMFHQIEGLVVDKGVTMGDLKGTLDTLMKKLYGEDTVTRFRPHHFPFTEPSCEVDVQCFECGGKGCRVCKGEGWIEILGAGMVHPKVLENCGIDSSVYTGYAFGLGLERLAMRRFDISDLRLVYENDVRFLSQF